MLRRVVVAFGVAFLLLAAPGQPSVGPAAGAPVSYTAPVDGEVLQGFDPPARRWGAGHRGVDLAARPGEAVRVAARGSVTFAGAVAGERWVTVTHPDGIRTSYGPLASVAVSTGEAVATGVTLGTVAHGHGAGALHWSARDADGYLDPLSLIGRQLVPTLVGVTEARVTDEPEYHRYRDWDGRAPGLRGAAGMVQGSPRARDAGWQLAPNPNHVIGVAGLNSDSSTAPIDLTHLGYAVDDITYLSYAGRDVRGGAGARRDQRPYDRHDTWEGVHAGAEKLRDQLRAQWRRAPGQAVDLVGHSMGGLVVTYYLMVLHDPADPTLPPIGHVATFASPLHGSDLATGLRSAARAPGVAELIRGVGALLGDPQPPPDGQVSRDLAVGSAVTGRVLDAWLAALADPYASPLGAGTRVLTVGGSRDLIVPEHRTSLPGGDHVVVPGGHDHMRRTEASRIVLRDFLAGEPPPGHAGGLGHVLSYPLGWGYQAIGAAIGGPGLLPVATP